MPTRSIASRRLRPSRSIFRLTECVLCYLLRVADTHDFDGLAKGHSPRCLGRAPRAPRRTSWGRHRRRGAPCICRAMSCPPPSCVPSYLDWPLLALTLDALDHHLLDSVSRELIQASNAVERLAPGALVHDVGNDELYLIERQKRTLGFADTRDPFAASIGGPANIHEPTRAEFVAAIDAISNAKAPMDRRFRLCTALTCLVFLEPIKPVRCPVAFTTWNCPRHA